MDSPAGLLTVLLRRVDWVANSPCRLVMKLRMMTDDEWRWTFDRARAGRKWHHDDGRGTGMFVCSRSFRWCNSQRCKCLRSRVIVLSVLLPVSCVTGATCVSALFRVNFLRVLFRADHDGVLGISIGGPVRKLWTNSQSPGLMKTFFLHFLMNL